MEFIIQSLGVIGIIASIISFQCKKHSSILFFRTMNEAFFGVQYFLLGAYTGMAMNLVGCVRNIIFSNQVQKGKNTFCSATIFSIFFVLFGIFTWAGFKSILIIIAKVISSFAYGNKNTTIVRTSILLTSSSWLIYNVFVGSFAGIVCEAFTLISLVAGIIRLDIIPRIKKWCE